MNVANNLDSITYVTYCNKNYLILLELHVR